MKYLLLVALLGFVGCNKEDSMPDIPGGVWQISTQVTPPNINPLSSTTVDATTLQSFVLEGLMDLDPDTYKWRPGLAEKVEISDDGMTYTFTLREGVKWHDGKPFTAEDVKFSFDIIFRDDYPTQRIRPYFENFDAPEIIGERQIRFKANKKYHKNFDVIASGGYLSIVPKHIYDKPSEEEKKELNRKLIGTGPFILKEFKRGKWARFDPNPDWWGRKVDHLKDTMTYGRILVRFIKGETPNLENFKKGRLSYMGLTSEQFVKKATGDGWGKDYHKVQVENKSVKSYQFIGFNLKEEIFKSKKVRKALSHLMNRELMIEKFQFGMSLPATGPLYQQNPYANPNVKPLGFDPKLALEYLRSEGWSDSDGDQILDKVIDGQKRNFSFTLIFPNQDYEKYLTIFKEDAKKAGVDIKLKLLEWNSFVKNLDDRKFEAVMLGWGGGSVNWDPKQIWHSEAMQGSSNFISYSNPEVDRLIDEARITMDDEARKPILHRVYELIADDAPYIFLFNRKYELYAYQNGIERPKDTFNYTIGTGYWRLTP